MRLNVLGIILSLLAVGCGVTDADKCECTFVTGTGTLKVPCNENRCVDGVTGYACVGKGQVEVFPPACLQCRPQTCESLGINCGEVSDGCGGTLNCGTCVAPASCGGGGTNNVCGCSPEEDVTFCARNGKNCGSVTAVDNCGTARSVNCGSCVAPKTCGGSGTPNVCGSPNCTPKTCAQSGKNCGQISDGCGGTLNCGTCSGNKVCGNNNVCECRPESDASFCQRLGKNCGVVNGVDNCGAQRSATCGSCASPESCGGAGVWNVCGTCIPKTCGSAGANCGSMSDGCGGTLQCGACTGNQLCGSSGQPNVCRACTPAGGSCNGGSACCTGFCYFNTNTCQCGNFVGDSCASDADCCSSGTVMDLSCDLTRQRCCRSLNKGCQTNADCCSKNCDRSTGRCIN